MGIIHIIEKILSSFSQNEQFESVLEPEKTFEIISEEPVSPPKKPQNEVKPVIQSEKKPEIKKEELILSDSQNIPKTYFKSKKENKKASEPPKKAAKTVCAADFYIPDVPHNPPVTVEHISLTFEQAKADGWHFKKKSNGKLRITNYTGSERNVIIPSEIDGAVVNELGRGAFSRADIDSLEIPSCIKKIKPSLCSQSKVRLIKIADGITEIPDNFAFGCLMLENVQLPVTVTDIGSSAFASCPKLEYISIPERCALIGDNAFSRSGIKGFAFRNSGYERQINGSAFKYTPLYYDQLIILKEAPKFDIYRVLLCGYGNKFSDDNYIKFPKAKVWFAKRAISDKTGRKFTYDLSECTEVCSGIDISDTSQNNIIPDRNAYKYNKFILPNNTRGEIFPLNMEVVYADGRNYDGYIHVSSQTYDKTEVNLIKLRLMPFSLQYQTKELYVRTYKNTEYADSAVHSPELEHISFTHLAGGHGELFAQNCINLHCIEWDEYKVYIPSSEFVGIWVHRQLLKAFTAKSYDYGVEIFDSSVIDKIFLLPDTKQKRYIPERNTKKLRGMKRYYENGRNMLLKQKQKIMLAADVLRSTESLFPKWNMYQKYLQNHRRYALMIIDKFPQEYADFLRDYYNV